MDPEYTQGFKPKYLAPKLYSDWCDTSGDDEHTKKITLYSKHDMIEFAEYVLEQTRLPEEDFPNIPLSEPTDNFPLWANDFVKAFAFIGLILFVFGGFFLIAKAWQ